MIDRPEPGDTFCLDRGPVDLSGLRLASSKFLKNCLDLHILYFLPKNVGSAGSRLKSLVVQETQEMRDKISI